MTELIIKNKRKRTRILVHNDISQLPVEQFNKINKYWMLHDDLGSSFEDIEKIHFTRLMLCLNSPDKLKKEIENLRVLMFNILNEVSPQNLAFAATIHSIDGVEVTDYSDENLNKIIAELSKKGLTNGELKKKILEIRDRVYSDLERFFPDIFTNIISLAFWSRLKSRTLKILQGISNPDIDVDKEIEDSNRYFGTLINPKIFTGKMSAELRYDKSFEQNCIELSQFINQPVKHVSAKEYFSLIQHYNRIVKKMKK